MCTKHGVSETEHYQRNDYLVDYFNYKDKLEQVSLKVYVVLVFYQICQLDYVIIWIYAKSHLICIFSHSWIYGNCSNCIKLFILSIWLVCLNSITSKSFFSSSFLFKRIHFFPKENASLCFDLHYFDRENYDYNLWHLDTRRVVF